LESTVFYFLLFFSGIAVFFGSERRISTATTVIPVGCFWGDALKAVTSFYGLLERFIPLVACVVPLRYFSPQKVEPEENEGRDCFGNENTRFAKDAPTPSC